MAESLTFSIGVDGDVTVRSYDELLKWLQKERNVWAWLVPGSPRLDRYGLAGEVQSTWNNVIVSVEQNRAQGQPLGHIRQFLTPLSSSIITVSTTTIGTTVLDIKESSGEVAAITALGFLKQRLSLQNVTFPEELLGLILSVFPNLSNATDWAERLKRERTNFRMATRSLQERVSAEGKARDDAAVLLFDRGRGIATRIFNMRRSSWRITEERWRAQATAAVQDAEERTSTSLKSIANAEQSYREFMRLKAPVEYWEKKGSSHGAKEKVALQRLYYYFPITTAILIALFVFCGKVLIDHPDTDKIKSPLALYVVVSGGLLLISTISFWIGRLLTKLYLSEHHLRNDAEERAVMTTTYLALTGEGAAGDADRQIILNALFRATPDGIVKDDGPGDIGLQGVLAKLLSK